VVLDIATWLISRRAPAMKPPATPSADVVTGEAATVASRTWGRRRVTNADVANVERTIDARSRSSWSYDSGSTPPQPVVS
jgi:hypothetical protein